MYIGLPTGEQWWMRQFNISDLKKQKQYTYIWYINWRNFDFDSGRMIFRIFLFNFFLFRYIVTILTEIMYGYFEKNWIFQLINQMWYINNVFHVFKRFQFSIVSVSFTFLNKNLSILCSLFTQYHLVFAIECDQHNTSSLLV